MLSAHAADSKGLSIDHLPREILGDTDVAEDIRESRHIMSLPLGDAWECFERDYRVAQIDRFWGNTSRTAEFVGIERSALHRKMKSLGISGGNHAKSHA